MSRRSGKLRRRRHMAAAQAKTCVFRTAKPGHASLATPVTPVAEVEQLVLLGGAM
jgi:hypothetical protein